MQGVEWIIPKTGGPRITPAVSSPIISGRPNLENMNPRVHADANIKSRLKRTFVAIIGFSHYVDTPGFQGLMNATIWHCPVMMHEAEFM
jgi:hypothetical protein